MVGAVESVVNPDQNVKVKHKEERLVSLLLPWESRIVKLERILIWERPLISAVVFVAVNILFCLVAAWGLLAVIALVCFASVAIETLGHFFFPNLHDGYPAEYHGSASVMSIEELAITGANVWQCIENKMSNLVDLRHRNRAKFFVSSVFILSTVAVIGIYINGFCMTYGFVLGILIYPGLRHYNIIGMVQEQVQPITETVEKKLNIKRKRRRRPQKDEVVITKKLLNPDESCSSEDEELLPFIPLDEISAVFGSDVARRARKLVHERERKEREATESEEERLTPVVEASECQRRRQQPATSHNDDNVLRDSSEDDFLSDDLPHFAQGLGSEMPSIDDNLDCSLATFTPHHPEMPSFDHRDHSSLSDGGPDNLSFVPSHFRKSSSEEDDEVEPLAEGLSFDNVPHEDDNGTDVVAMLGGIISQGKASLVSAVASNAPSVVVTALAATASRFGDVAAAVKDAASAASAFSEQEESISERGGEIASFSEQEGGVEETGEETVFFSVKGGNSEAAPFEQDSGSAAKMGAEAEEISSDVDKEFVFLERDELDEPLKEDEELQ